MWIYNIVAAILAYEISGSAFVVGMVSVAQFGPQLVLAPSSGTLADRRDRRHQLIAARSLVILGSGSLALWVWTAGPDGLPGVWPVIGAAFIVGLGFVLASPAQESLVPALVRPNELAPAIALNAVPPTFARTVGPAVGAVVAASLGPAVAFGITALTNLVFALVIISIRVDARAPNHGGSDRSFRAGIRHMSKDKVLVLLLGGVIAVGVGADPAITLAPALAKGLGAGTHTVGAFASAFGVGSLFVFAVLGMLRRRMGLPRLATTGLTLFAVGIGVAGVLPFVPAAMAGFVVAGIESGSR